MNRSDRFIQLKDECFRILSSKELNRVGLAQWFNSVFASHTVGRGFASRPGHTKDHHKISTNCLPPWHAMC